MVSWVTPWHLALAALGYGLALHVLDFAPFLTRNLVTATSLGFPVYFAVLGKFRLNRPRWPVAALMLLLVYATPGLLMNKMFFPGTKSLFIALVSALLVIAAQLVPPSMAAVNVDSALRTVTRLGLVFLASSAAALVVFQATNLPLIMACVRIHERSFLLPVALVAGILRRSSLVTATAAILLATIFVIDPRTTELLVCVIAAAALMYHVIPRQVKPVVSALIAIAALVGSVGAYAVVKQLNEQFKTSVGTVSSDNTEFREEMWTLGLKKFWESPLFGTAWTSGGGYTPSREYGNVYIDAEDIDLSRTPLHNDFLETLAAGGLLGLGLFGAATMGIAVMAFRNYRKCERLNLVGHRDYNLILFITAASGMLTFAANPVLNNQVNGPLFWMTAALIVAEDRHLTATLRPPGRPRRAPSPLTRLA